MDNKQLDEVELARRLAQDGLPVRDVGVWTKSKHYHLRRYLNTFTVAMRDKWAALHYVDLFAGPGLCRVPETDEFLLGSPLIAARTRYPFQSLHLCDFESASCEALRVRLAILAKESGYLWSVHIHEGDANRKASAVVRAIPPKGVLSVAFLDPTALQLDFATLKTLATRPMDLLIYFPDHTDINRNYMTYYWNNPESRLDAVMGTSGWRTLLEQEASKGHDATIKAFRGLYRERLSTLGYMSEEESISDSKGRHLYVLIFASRDEAGIGFWRRLVKREPGGQRRFEFDTK